MVFLIMLDFYQFITSIYWLPAKFLSYRMQQRMTLGLHTPIALQQHGSAKQISMPHHTYNTCSCMSCHPPKKSETPPKLWHGSFSSLKYMAIFIILVKMLLQIAYNLLQLSNLRFDRRHLNLYA